MKQAFNDYFQKMGLSSGEQQKRLFEVYHAASVLLPEEIMDVFISQSNDEKEGPSHFDSLWFISNNYVLESKEFLDRSDFEVHNLKGLQNLRLILENFNLQKLDAASPGTKSTILVEFNVPNGGRVQLHAYGGNCAKLAGIALEYLQKNLQ